MLRLLLLVALSSIAAPGRASEPAPIPADEASEHRHLGFLLRIDGGTGYLGTSATSSSGGSVSSTGFAIPLGVAVGGAVVENVVLGGEAWGLAALAPVLKSGGEATSGGGARTLACGAGVNLTWYFMPANLYASVTPSVTVLRLVGDPQFTSRIGFGAKIGFGKEWWVGPHWGIGAVAQLFFSVNDDTVDPGQPSTWTTLAGGISLSATYN